MSPSKGRPLKVGFQVPEVEREVRWPEVLEMVRLGEDIGFDSIWTGDHLLYRTEALGSRGPVGGVDLARRDRRLDVADRHRASRGLHELP